MFDDYLSWKPFFEIVPMAHGDCADVAELHTSRFTQAWSEGEFSSLLSQNSVFGALARQTNAFFSQPLGGFVLSREAGGEAEILTVAVSDKFAGAGLGWRLMQAAMREALMRGAETMFLEVDGRTVRPCISTASSASRRSQSARPITRPRMGRNPQRLSCAAIFDSSVTVRYSATNMVDQRSI